MLTLPSERPLQLISITLADMLIESGCEIMIESILAHPLSSTTCTLYNPAWTMVDVVVELSCHKIEYGFVPPKGYADIKADPP